MKPIQEAKEKKSRKKIDNPTERQTGQDTLYAYIIKDKIFGEFNVLNSANAWWKDQVKVENLISAYKIDATDEEATSYAGITPENLRYFKELHSDFLRVKAACKEMPVLKARQTAVQKIGESYANAMDYLKRKKKDEFGDHLNVDQKVTSKIISLDE